MPAITCAMTSTTSPLDIVAVTAAAAAAAAAISTTTATTTAAVGRRHRPVFCHCAQQRRLALALEPARVELRTQPIAPIDPIDRIAPLAHRRQ
eukprot:4343462-Pleurochrysis_carterae.AAC.2